MPQPTDLVTDLPADFEVFGQAVATSLADLLGGTSGQVLAKNSNTDMDFVWVAQDDSNAIQNAIVDAKGDLIAATAADTPARLAVGTNGQVLSADSSAATGLVWATPVTGGMTVLASGTLTNAALSLTSISGSYNDLRLVMRDWQVASAGDLNFRVNTDTSTAYMNCRTYVDSAGSGSAGSGGILSSFNINAGSSKANIAGHEIVMDFFDYANTSAYKIMMGYLTYTANATNTLTSVLNNDFWQNTSAITGISSTTTFSTASYILYGVK
jgi:hypothetical protein